MDYSEILLQDYAGKYSELYILNSLLYLNIILDIDLDKLIMSVISDIKKLGIVIYQKRLPKFNTIECYTNKDIYFNYKYLDYSFDIDTLIDNILKLNVQMTEHVKLINDKNIRNTLKILIRNNKKSVKMLKYLENKL